MRWLSKRTYSAKEILERASKTFIQGFISSLTITLPNTDFTTKGVWQSVLIGAIASGISAVMNWFSNLLNSAVMNWLSNLLNEDEEGDSNDC